MLFRETALENFVSYDECQQCDMQSKEIFCIVTIALIAQLICIDIVIGYKLKRINNETLPRCGIEYKVKWVKEISSSPFVSSPLIHDLNADGSVDIIAVSYSESISVLHVEDGSPHGDEWPLVLFDKIFLSSPILFDVNSDGMLDIVLISSTGEILTFNAMGHSLQSIFQLPSLYIDRKWHEKVVSSSTSHIHDFILDSVPTPDTRAYYIAVDPHVLSTPALVDVNNDDRVEELIVSVSYYFDLDDYIDKTDFAGHHNLSFDKLDIYMSSAVVIVNLTSMSVLHTVHLDLTTKISQFPAYLPHPVTLVDVDMTGGPLEIVVGTLSGNLHVINSDGTKRAGFPITVNPVYSMVLVMERFSTRDVIFIINDASGNLACLDKFGKTVWESEVPDTPVGDLQLYYPDSGTQQMIGVTTVSGMVYFISPESGEVFNKFSVQLGKSAVSDAKQIQSTFKHSSFILAALSNEGNLHWSGFNFSCRGDLQIGESSYVSLLPLFGYDSFSQSDFLLASKDGALTYLEMTSGGRVKRSSALCYSDHFSEPDRAFPKLSVGIGEGQVMEVSTSTFFIVFDIIDPNSSKSFYIVKIYYGNKLLTSENYSQPGRHVVSSPSSPNPGAGHLIVQMTNHYGYSIRCIVPVRFHHQSLQDIRLFFLASAIAFLVILNIPSLFVDHTQQLPVSHHNAIR